MPAAVCPPLELRETEASQKNKGEPLCECSWSAAINNSYQGCSPTAREIQGLNDDILGITGRRNNIET